MKAVDTNVLVRLVTGDDAPQAEIAGRIVSGGVWISDGVLMEVEWVLRSFYRWPRQRIVGALADLIGQESVVLRSKAELDWVLDRYASGADWADMYHLLDARGLDGFLTFDRRLPARKDLDLPVSVELLAA